MQTAHRILCEFPCEAFCDSEFFFEAVSTNLAEDYLSKNSQFAINGNGGGAGSHTLDEYEDGKTLKLGLIYKKTTLVRSTQQM